VVVRSVITGLD